MNLHILEYEQYKIIQLPA